MRTHMRTTGLTVISIALAVMLTGCGYTLSSTGSQTGPTKGVSKVFVPPFVNDTYEPLIEKDFTAALKENLAADGRWVLTDRESSDLRVDGRVKTFTLEPLSYDEKEKILEYRIVVSTAVKVTETKTGKVVVAEQPIQTFADYRLTEDITKSKIRRGEAIRKASQNFAEEFIIKVLDIF
jgi:outer membrane lipopolysaccharide assembly protein LptE/RlpB